jgi:hypothetical protein
MRIVTGRGYAFTVTAEREMARLVKPRTLLRRIDFDTEMR